MIPQDISGLFSAEEYADLVTQADEIFRTSQNADAVVRVLTERIVQALETNQRVRQRQTQLEGIAAARARGVHLGRPKIKTPAIFPMVLKQYLDGNLSVSVAANLCGVAVSTFYRMKRDALAEEMQERPETV